MYESDADDDDVAGVDIQSDEIAYPEGPNDIDSSESSLGSDESFPPQTQAEMYRNVLLNTFVKAVEDPLSIDYNTVFSYTIYKFNTERRGPAIVPEGLGKRSKFSALKVFKKFLTSHRKEILSKSSSIKKQKKTRRKNKSNKKKKRKTRKH